MVIIKHLKTEGGGEGQFVRHTSCPECGSSDARAVYSNGSSYCFSCGTWFPPEDKKKKNSNFRKGSGKDLIKNLTFKQLKKRRISKEACRKFGYGYAKYNGETVQVAPYRDSSGRLVAQHIRTKDKRFRWLGDTDDIRLFGQNLWNNTGKRLVITEGEIDAMTIAEVFNLSWAVVSVPNGAQSAKKYIKQNIEFIEGYKEVVFAFDNDEDGREAVEECAPLIKTGKAKVANFTPYNDANEMAQDGKKSKISNLIFEAKEFRPDGIVSFSDMSFEELMSDDDIEKGYELQFPELDKKMKSLRKGELTTIAAGTGAGKSTFAREIAYHLFKEHDTKIGYVALEEGTKKSAIGFMAMDLDVPLGDLYMDKSIVKEERRRDSYEKFRESDNIYFYDHFGSLEANSLITKIKYLANGLDVDFIVLDHISIVVSGIETGDERRTIDNLMTRLRQIVEHSGVGLILISHLRVPQGKKKAHEEGGRVTLNQLRGSGSIKQLSDNIIAIERDQQDREQSNVSNIRLLKCRLVGNPGLAGQAKYNPVTGRMKPFDGDSKDVPSDNEEQVTEDAKMFMINDEGEEF